ncbi:lactosylceramide 4-alpha-galactosyltransferase-like [Panulirus ornatus]|uniref:lactosylceramide 4-alpha-galactosyltransferase-like n=1 Tax=Panulirus ornatus TaxID=150431 RepID=UPI003A843E8A
MMTRTSGLNVFLVESSCSITPSYRAWCAVESLAQQNPLAQVWYVMTSGMLNLRNGLAVRLVERYPNLRPVTANLQQVFSGTPLMNLYTSREWSRNTDWPEINLADLVRLGLVWHLGGFYLDSDVVCIRPLTNLTNAIGWQERSTLGSGVFHFTRNHPVLLEVMKYAAETFQSGVWGSSGPQAFTAVLKHKCGNKIQVLDGTPQCQGVTVLPIKAFYPVPATIWKTLFTPQAYRKITQRYPFSYVIHTWNQKSSSQPILKDSGSIYDEAARVFCPVTRSFATAHSSTY